MLVALSLKAAGVDCTQPRFFHLPRLILEPGWDDLHTYVLSPYLWHFV